MFSRVDDYSTECIVGSFCVCSIGWWQLSGCHVRHLFECFPVRFAEIPPLHWLTCDWSRETWWRDQRWSMLWSRELIQHSPCRNARIHSMGKCKAMVGVWIPTLCMKAGWRLWVIQESEVICWCPFSERIPICAACVVSPFTVLAVKISSIKIMHWLSNDGNDVGVSLVGGGLYTLTIVVSSILIASHSISELKCDRATVDQVASCDTKVARPWSLLVVYAQSS